MNAQPRPPLPFHRTTVESHADDDAMAPSAHAVDSSEAQGAAPPLSWKQRLFVAMLFLIVLLLSFAAVCSIDPPAVVLSNQVPQAAAHFAGSSPR